MTLKRGNLLCHELLLELVQLGLYAGDLGLRLQQGSRQMLILLR